MAHPNTPIGRALYPSLATTSVFNGVDSGKYQISILIPPSADLSVIEREVAAAISKKWGTKPPSSLRGPIRPIEEFPKLDQKEFAGYSVIKLKTKYRPQVVGPDLQPIDPGDPDGVYSGCLVRASFSAYGYAAMGNLGVSLSLHHVQKVEDGERIGNSSSAESDFEPLTKPPAGDGLSFI